MNNEELRRNKYRRKKAMLRKVQNKMGVAFFVIILVLFALAVRILLINYNHGEAYSKTVLDHQSYTSTTIPYKRGQIQDANGTVLAYSERVYNLILDPKLILSDEKYKEPTLTALTECFDLKRSDLESILATKSTSQYEKLLKELTKDEISEFESRVEDTKNNPYIKGVWFEDSYIRKYPFSTLAADVIGFASAANGGELGLENYYDEELSGTDGISYSYVGENLDVETQEKKAEDGYNLVTTIDYKVQSIIENKIKELNAERPSKSTAVIAMNPKTGEILAMASYPTFNLNNPRDLSGVYTQEELSTMTDIEMTNAMYALWSNYCVSTIYEPGSTFKPFTVAEGLEEGVIHDGDTFYCGGFMEVSGRIINCHEHSGHGTVTVKEGLIFTNLVDFDMLYGHRNDPKGYGKALEDFDNRLQEIYSKMTDEDIFIITADHGCDPTTSSTDHSREHIPVLVYGKNVKPGVNIGTRERFSDIGKTILDFFNVKNELVGDSFFNKIME